MTDKPIIKKRKRARIHVGPYNIEELSCAAQMHIQQQIYPKYTVVDSVWGEEIGMKYTRVHNMILFLRTLSDWQRSKLYKFDEHLEERYLFNLLSRLSEIEMYDIHILEFKVLASALNSSIEYSVHDMAVYITSVQQAREVLSILKIHDRLYGDKYDRFVDMKETDEIEQALGGDKFDGYSEAFVDEVIYDEKTGSSFQENIPNTPEEDNFEELFSSDETEDDMHNYSSHVREALEQARRDELLYQKYMGPLTEEEMDNPDQPCTEESLCGKCIISINPMEDKYMDKSVIYITSCNSQQVTGVMINKTLYEADRKILQPSGEPQLPSRYKNIRFGGPENSCFCHIFFPAGLYLSRDKRALYQHGTIITSSPHILQDYFNNRGPNPCFICMGQYLWTPQQFHWQLSTGNWEIVSISKELLFNTPSENMWEKLQEERMHIDSRSGLFTLPS